MTIKYTISGSLPAAWEDFISAEPTRYPHFTLMTRRNAEQCGVETGDGSVDSDYFLDLVLDVEKIDENIAATTIAKALAVEPSAIVIEQQAWLQAV